jgi:hypothetical protein
MLYNLPTENKVNNENINPGNVSASWDLNTGILKLEINLFTPTTAMFIGPYLIQTQIGKVLSSGLTRIVFIFVKFKCLPVYS